MSGHGPGTCCGNHAFMEVARLAGENTRLQFESTRLGGELTRLSDEITRLRDEKSQLAAEVKRLSDEITRLRDEKIESAAEDKRLIDAAAEIPTPAPPPPVVKKFIYLMDPAYEFSTTLKSSRFGYGMITESSWGRVKTKDGDFLLASEVSPQGGKMRDSVLIFDKMIVDTDGLTFVREFP